MFLNKLVKIKKFYFIPFKHPLPFLSYSNNFKCFSEWKKQQEIKKKIIDENEAENLHNKINSKNFEFSIWTGCF